MAGFSSVSVTVRDVFLFQEAPFRRRGRRRRVIPEGARVHRSVIERMSDPDARYAPKLPERYVIAD